MKTATIIILNEDLNNTEEFEKAMSEQLLKLWYKFMDDSTDGFTYEDLDYWEKVFKPDGLTFDYELRQNLLILN